MEVVKIIDYTRPWLGKDGKTRPNIAYYLRDEVNGNKVSVCIDVHFKESARDLNVLDLLSRKIIKRADEVK